MSADCPCGSGETLATCCGPLLDGHRLATTAVELMRSRYTAYAIGHGDHLWRTWHPATRPATVDPGTWLWTGLEILDVVDGGPDDPTGEVEFIASGGPQGRLRERSRFERRAGRWFYRDGAVGD